MFSPDNTFFRFPTVSISNTIMGRWFSLQRVVAVRSMTFKLTGLLRRSSILVGPQSQRGAFSVATGSCSLPHVLPVPLSVDLRPWDGVREAVSLLSS